MSYSTYIANQEQNNNNNYNYNNDYIIKIINSRKERDTVVKVFPNRKHHTE